MNTRSPARGALYALAGAALFGINGSVAKVVLAEGLTAPQLTLFRAASTALIAGVWLLATDRTQFRVSVREVAGLALLGVFGLAMIQWLYAVAISLMPVGIALLIEYTAVIIVALAAWQIFHEPVSKTLWWAIGAVITGLAVVANVWDSTLNPLGTIAALGAAVTYAFYFLAGERGVTTRPPLAVAFWASLFAAGVWFIFGSWWRMDPAWLATPVSLDGALADVVTPVWAPLLWVMTLGAFAPFMLSFMALRDLSATKVGILASAEVPFAFIVAWLWLGESLTTLQVMGTTVVIAGIVLAQISRHTVMDTAPMATAGDVPLTPENPGEEAIAV